MNITQVTKVQFSHLYIASSFMTILNIHKLSIMPSVVLANPSDQSDESRFQKLHAILRRKDLAYAMYAFVRLFIFYCFDWMSLSGNVIKLQPD